MTRVVSSMLGISLVASTLYLLALLFGYVFGLGHVRRHHVEAASYIFVLAAVVTAFVHRGDRGVRVPQPDRRAWVVSLAGFIAASCALYGNTIWLGLFSDDFVLAERALEGRWLAHGEFVRPLPAALWAMLLSITRNPAALHGLNVLLHGTNAALDCILSSRLGVPRGIAAAAGLLFLTFPASVEAVVWPAAVPDLLVAACALGFLVLSQARVSRGRGITALAVLACGLLCKESAIAIPLLAIVIWTALPNPRQTPGLRLLVAGVVICTVYSIIRMIFVQLPESYAQVPSRYLAKELIARPLAILSMPWTTAALARWPLTGYVWALAVITAAATYAWRRDKPVTPSLVVRCLGAVIVAVLPVYSMLFITADLENARYLYLSTAFWAIAVCGIASAPLEERRMARARTAVAVAAIATGAIGVQWHLATWREAARLRERVLTAAQAAIDTAPCSTVSLAGAPDSVRGAYVFRNGLAEALAARAATSPLSASDPLRGDDRSLIRRLAPAAQRSDDCLLVWNGSAFQIATNGSAPVQATVSRHPRLDGGLN